MKSETHGKRISRASVKRITRTGIRVEVDGNSYFLRYAQFPWFRGANPQAVREVQLLGPDHLQWPVLDIDLSLESIRNPERYPLVSRDRS
jgi:hypothetical protein